MYFFRDYNEGGGRGDFENILREQHSESNHEMNGPFRDHVDTVIESIGDSKQNLTEKVHPRILTWESGNLRHLQQSEAAEKLKNTLYSMRNSSPATLSVGSLPTPEEAVILLRNQAAYTSHLESESAYIKEEIAIIKMKLAEVLEENRSLHNELKTAVVHEILKDGGEIVNVMGTIDHTFTDSFTFGMSRNDFKRWQIELERLSKLHNAKTDRLESHLSYSKSEVEKLELVVEDLKSQLRTQESIPTHENGLFFGSAFLSETQRNITHRTIEKLTKERDELMDHVTALQTQLKERAQREEDAYQQMKKGIQLVEQAQLEQTEALVEKEQAREELMRVRQRFEDHIRESQTLMKAERETARRESQTLIDDLNSKLKELAELYTLVHAKYEKEVRDKATLSNEISELKSQLRTCDREVTVTAESYKTETTNASLQRNSALYESNRLRSELEKERHQHDQEMSRTKIELDDLRQRLNKAERELINSKEECIHMTSEIQALERELHLAKMTRDTVERSRLEDIKVIRKQAEDRENQLKFKIEEADDKHSQATHEMDTMIIKQNKLILKLREECKKQTLHLEKTIKKYRNHNGKLQQINGELVKRMERMTLRVTELENQADQHGRVHEKMKDRLRALDEQAQNQAVQLVEAITKYSQTSRDRQILAREVEFLRTQLHRATMTSTEVFRLNSSSKVLVDDILNTMTKDERDGTISLIPQLQINTQEKADIEETFSESV